MAVLPAKDHSKTISLGIYTGAAVQYGKWDWEEAFDIIYPSPYNWVSIHGTTPWDNPDSRFFLERDATGKFFTNKPDEKYYDHVKIMLHEASRHDIGVEWGFFDQYHVRRWLWSKWKTCKYHWLRSNDANIDWGGPHDPSFTQWETFIYPLYSNWKHKVPAHDAQNVFWLKFKTDAQDNLTWYEPSNKIGEAIVYYIDRIFSIVAEVKKERPRLKFRYKGFNESHLFVEEGEWAGGRDVDERTLRLIRKLAKDHGLVPTQWFREYVDVNIYNLPSRKLDAGRYRQLLNLNPALHVEVHGIDNPLEIMALNNSRVLYSSDGADEDGYYDRMKKISQLNLPKFDYKMVPNKTWDSKVMINNLKNAIIPMTEIHK